jgi:Fe-S cluster biogenesis protein NfuA
VTAGQQRFTPATVSAEVEAILDQLAASPDPSARAAAEELVRHLMEMYGEALSRVVTIAESTPLLEQLERDDLVASLLVLHDLHPRSLAERVEQALERVRPYAASHGGRIEVADLDAEAGAVLLRLSGTCGGCAFSQETLNTSVQSALALLAPEICQIDLAEARETPDDFIPLTVVAAPAERAAVAAGGRA